MEKITNMQQATDYVYDKIKDMNPEVEKSDIYDTIMDEVLESSEYIMMDEDIRFLEDNEKNPEAIDEYLARKIPDYQDLLDDIVTDMVSEEILEEGE